MRAGGSGAQIVSLREKLGPVGAPGDPTLLCWLLSHLNLPVIASMETERGVQLCSAQQTSSALLTAARLHRFVPGEDLLTDTVPSAFLGAYAFSQRFI